MTCDTPGSDVWTEGGGLPHGGPGLVKGHAYSLLQVCARCLLCFGKHLHDALQEARCCAKRVFFC
jgi:hypothetical protein